MDAGLPIAFESQLAWRAWLEQHGSEASEVWVKFAKKASGIEGMTYGEAVEVALCYGWIDGQAKGLDENWSLQRFTPRRARSNWSKLNRAKADGRWDA